MTKETKYLLTGVLIILIALLALCLLVSYDKSENAFYNSCGVVPFTQYLLLSAGGLSLVCSVVSAWFYLMRPITFFTFVRLAFLVVPLMVCGSLLTYASLLFFCWI